MKTEYKPYVDALIELAIREDIGDGDHTSLCCIPADERGGVCACCASRRGHHRWHRDRTARSRTARPHRRIRPADRRRHARASGRRSLLRVRGPALAVAGRTHPAQHHAAHERRSHADGSLRGAARRAAHQRCSTPARRRPACAYWTKWPSNWAAARTTRMGLFDMILLKDNHIDFAGGIVPAIRGAKQYLRERDKNIPIEVRSPHARRYRPRLRGRRRRPHHVRQFLARDDAQGGRKGRRTLRNRVERRHHARYAAHLRRDGRGLHLWARSRTRSVRSTCRSKPASSRPQAVTARRCRSRQACEHPDRERS